MASNSSCSYNSFFISKKSKKIWGIFILIMLLDISFAYFLEPDIVNKKINEVSFEGIA